MNPAARLEILGTLDSRIGTNQSRLFLVRDTSDIGLILELTELWRVLRDRADLHQWIATLLLTRFDPERTRSIALFYSPFPRAETREQEPKCERARDPWHALEMLRGASIAPPPRKAPAPRRGG